MDISDTACFPPFPVAKVNGRFIGASFQVSGCNETFHTLQAALEHAMRMEPPRLPDTIAGGMWNPPYTA